MNKVIYLFFILIKYVNTIIWLYQSITIINVLEVIFLRILINIDNNTLRYYSQSLLITMLIIRLANRFFPNNWLFSISILVPKQLFILFNFFFSRESKIYCISDCLQKGPISTKSYCLVLTKNVKCFRILEQLSKNDQHLL